MRLTRMSIADAFPNRINRALSREVFTKTAAVDELRKRENIGCSAHTWGPHSEIDQLVRRGGSITIEWGNDNRIVVIV
jgi:hypothetical protein